MKRKTLFICFSTAFIILFLSILVILILILKRLWTLSRRRCFLYSFMFDKIITKYNNNHYHKIGCPLVWSYIHFRKTLVNPDVQVTTCFIFPILKSKFSNDGILPPLVHWVHHPQSSF